MRWNAEDLQLAILTVLLEARDTGKCGATYRSLKLGLSVLNEREITAALDWLKHNHYIYAGKKSAVITDDGELFLKDMRPHLKTQRHGGSGDYGQGWWAPPDDPDNPSGVPRRPMPYSGAGEVALPLPYEPMFE